VADRPHYPDTEEEPGGGARRGLTTGMPRWVKVFLIIMMLLVLVLVVSLLAGVRHGPGLHTPPGDGGGRTPPVEHGP
jgi:hypothetical protein